jgi:hypothetical protein
MTSFEIARAGGFDRVATARRLPDCVMDGLVHRCPMRSCRVTGKPAITWRIGRPTATANTPVKPRPHIGLVCRYGEVFTVPAETVQRMGGDWCKSCRRFYSEARS